MIAGTVLYFYPPNIPLKFKMTLLGLAFLLALGGLFILDHLSYGLALAAILGIAFVISYVTEKRMNLVTVAAGGKITEELVSSKSEVKLDDSKVNVGALGSEIAVTIDEVPVSEEIEMKQEVTSENLNVEVIPELNSTEPIDVIELLDMELEEFIIEETEIAEIEVAEPAQELELKNQLAELTDDEFAFLTETREISEEEVTDLPVATDIEDVDIFLQRSALLEELDEEETHEELSQEEKIVLLEEVVEMVDEVPHTDEEEEVYIPALSTPAYAEEVITAEEIVTETEEIPVTEEIHFIEEPINLEEILMKDPEHVNTTPDQIEAIVEEIVIANVIEEVEEIDAAEFSEATVEEQGADTFETETDNQVVEETKFEPAIPDMNAEVQDMLLNTLFSYQNQGDYASYQVMAETILNQPLSDKDYYLFGKLLLDSYAESNEFTRVRDLLEVMEARLQSYPVIAEELERYKDIFLVKQ
ncbi:hypothetical protein QUF49_03740 [Fictibacillus sp. b24]|uniref:hypothetical protein n=1 Tax=Fictibacillus sp. b24 TaxID=3055863 RepID=UPI0025A1FC35|nr:hypothetical protein [Fictibacillus sp. b24]MDM5315093.1 hypothetical protein [Fictibacillus sp. b24]